MKKILIAGLLSATSLFLLPGCTDSDSSSPIPEPPVSPGVDKNLGALVWDNYTTTVAGGSGALPVGATNKDFVRCKACHGWDGKGAAGGYVRRSAKATRPNPTPGIGDISAKAIAGTVTTDDAYHVATGRLFSVEDQSMPNYFQDGGLTPEQADNVVSFLNTGDKITTFADMDIMPNPVGYSFNGATSAAAGATLFASQCVTCHGADGALIPVDGKASIGIYMSGDGKYSEGFHKIMYGVPGTSMTRAAVGNLTAQNAADILAYIQDTFSPDYYKGALIWDNWTTADAGGAGLPSSATNKDFLRCKACHGWDGKGAAGGYVRRSAKATRPNPTPGIGDLTLKMGTVAAAAVEHAGGRLFSIEDQTMPNFIAAEGLNAKQVDDVVAFLNSGPKVTDHATLDIMPNPVGYSFNGATSAAAGATLFASQCVTCHGADGALIPVDGKASIGIYMSGDGKYSEGFHKIIYGVPGTSMTRKAVGNLTSQNAADILAYIQDTFSPDYYKGALVWDNWTTADAGGAGALPAIATNKDFLRCKACHGWDGKGLEGGYVRRSATATRPNPDVTGDLTAKMGTVAAAAVEHAAGRAFDIEDQTMPNFTATEGLTAKQVADVVAFLNSGPKVTDHATLDIVSQPVVYTFNGTSAVTGETLYTANCAGCHDADGMAFSVDGKTGIGDYMDGDGKYSEGFNKIMYGVPGTSMTRKAVGNLTSQNAADILTYIQAEIGVTFPIP